MDTKERIETLRSAVDKGGSLAHANFLAYIAIIIYFFVSVTSTTHEDILRETSKSIPLLNIQLPLLWFFCIGPWALTFIHFNQLLQLKYYTKLIHQLDDYLERQQHLNMIDEERSMAISFTLSYIILDKKMNALLKFIIKFVLIIFFVLSPLFVLLLFQGYFLPYHSTSILNIQRSAILFDTFIVIILWPSDLCFFDLKLFSLFYQKILATKFQKIAHRIIPITATIIICFISFALLALPQEWQNCRNLSTKIYFGKWINSIFPCNLDLPNRIFIGAAPNQELIGLYANSINNHEKTFIELIKIQNLGIDLRNRDLSYANFSESKFPSANFSGAKLKKTNFRGSILQNAQFINSKIRHTLFDNADLQSSKFLNLEIKNASFINSKLQNTMINNVKISDSNFSSSSMNGVLFVKTGISRTKFLSTYLQGSVLISSTIVDSNFANSDLKGSYVRDTTILGSNMSSSQFGGSDLKTAKFIADDFSFCEFESSDLRNTNFQLSNFNGSIFKLTNAAYTDFTMTEFNPKKIDWSSFEKAKFETLEEEHQDMIFNELCSKFPTVPKELFVNKINDAILMKSTPSPNSASDLDPLFSQKFYSSRVQILRSLACENPFVEQRIFEQLLDQYRIFLTSKVELKAPLDIIHEYTRCECEETDEIALKHNKALIKKYFSKSNVKTDTELLERTPPMVNGLHPLRNRN